MTKETKQHSTDFSAQDAPEQSPCVFRGRPASLPHSGWAAADGNGVPVGPTLGTAGFWGEAL